MPLASARALKVIGACGSENFSLIVELHGEYKVLADRLSVEIGGFDLCLDVWCISEHIYPTNK